MVWRTLGRIIWIPFALSISAVIGALVLVSLGLERITQATHGNWQDGDTLASLYDLIVQGQALASGLTVVPPLAVVIIGEVARIRSMLYYVLCGGLAVIAVPLLARYSDTGTVTMLPSTVWQVLATAGFAGGWIYWLLAGRSA